MTNQEINERVASLLGIPMGRFLPDNFASNRNHTQEIINHINARRPAMSVAFLNALRDVLGPRMPKNKAGSPVISDWDLFMATPREICEAFLKAVEKGKK